MNEKNLKKEVITFNNRQYYFIGLNDIGEKVYLLEPFFNNKTWSDLVFTIFSKSRKAKKISLQVHDLNWCYNYNHPTTNISKQIVIDETNTIIPLYELCNLFSMYDMQRLNVSKAYPFVGYYNRFNIYEIPNVICNLLNKLNDKEEISQDYFINMAKENMDKKEIQFANNARQFLSEIADYLLCDKGLDKTDFIKHNANYFILNR